MAPQIVCIDGNIGAGKSTLLNALKEQGFFVFVEDVIDWGVLLDRFYSDEKRWMCTLQLAILHSMHQQYKKMMELDVPIVFVERSPRSSMVFAANGVRQGFLDEEEMKVIQNMFDVLKWEPTKTFYLNTSVDVCFKRMKQRGRDCEQNVSIEYLQFLHESYHNIREERTDVVLLNAKSTDELVKDIFASLTTSQ